MSVHEIGIERKQFIVVKDESTESFISQKMRENLRNNGFFTTLQEWAEDVEQSGGTISVRGQRHYATLRGVTIGVFHEDTNLVKNEGYLLSPREIWSRGLYRAQK